MKGRVNQEEGIQYYIQLPYSILLHQSEQEGERYWIAEIAELPGCKSHGSTVDEAVKSVEEAKRDWILDSLEEGDEIPVPIERDRFSGKTIVRMSRSLHRALSLLAESEKLSLNQLIVTMLAKEVGRLGVLNRVEGKLDALLDRVDDVLHRETGRESVWGATYGLITGGAEQCSWKAVTDDPFVLGVTDESAADDNWVTVDMVRLGQGFEIKSKGAYIGAGKPFTSQEITIVSGQEVEHEYKDKPKVK